MRHDEQMARARMTERQEAVLILRVVGVGEGDGQRIAEDGRRLGEGDSVLGKAAGRLVGIPLELYEFNVPGGDPTDKPMPDRPRAVSFSDWC